MLNLHNIIEKAAFTWMPQEKADAQWLPGQTAYYFPHTAEKG